MNRCLIVLCTLLLPMFAIAEQTTIRLTIPGSHPVTIPADAYDVTLTLVGGGGGGSALGGGGGAAETESAAAESGNNSLIW
ncbi:MAG: hypothetical protein AAF512_10210 [Pseudomonadota bacterium]